MLTIPLLASAATELEVAHSAQLAPFVLIAVLLALVTIYLASRILGEIAIRLSLPPVLGELIGGVIVGSSLLSLLVFGEGGGETLTHLAESSGIIRILQATAGLETTAIGQVFASQREIVDLLSEIGVIILLFEIGLESDLKELIRVGPQAAVVAVVGVAVPFTLGTLGLIFAFHLPTIPSVFAGAALTATSIGITARVLAELQKLSTSEGQIIIGAAVLDDVLGIMILAVVAGLAKTGEINLADIGLIVVSAVVFLVGSIVLGRLLSPYLVQLIDQLKTRGNPLVPALILAFALAYVGQVIHLEAILGAFAAGLILGETEKRHDLEEQIRPISDLFVPIFFVCVGAKTNLAVLNPLIPANREGLIIAIFLIGVAIVGKLVAGIGAFGKPGINRYAIGVGMIPRGEVGLVFAGVGAASGVLSDSLDVSIIVMVIVTTFIAPLWLRSALQAEPSPEATGSLLDLQAQVVGGEGDPDSASAQMGSRLIPEEESSGSISS
ncbi:MAG: cation:proton antiporter [Cyanobacteriota bacterium]|nr:cation:proton antiporter [Cyanobacteriota bacterium]